MNETAHQEHAVRRRPSLYVVATPIGNLADITLRAIETLKTVDLIAAEDTRHAARLLQHYGITTKVLTLHEHNERAASQKLIAELARGKSIALITDAGTPAVSDPGALAVAAVRSAGFAVVPIPGPNAAICALSAAGLTAPHFLFYGFLPQQAAARRRALESLATVPHLIVFYEAPHRVAASVGAMAEVFGERTITIARELTKVFETVHSCALGDAAAWFAADANRLKGEFVLLVEGAVAADAPQGQAVERVLAVLLPEVSLKQAVKLAVEITGARKNDVYELALKLGKRG